MTVVTFAAGFPRVEEVLTAARAASRLTDARLAQVFDVEDDWDNAYIVMEWAAGETLATCSPPGRSSRSPGPGSSPRPPRPCPWPTRPGWPTCA